MFRLPDHRNQNQGELDVGYVLVNWTYMVVIGKKLHLTNEKLKRWLPNPNGNFKDLGD